jgi:hypothetical protein
MVLVPMALFTEADPLPGLPTLVPVLGAALLLTLAEARQGPGRWLALTPMRGLGLISYSAYLVHQPVLAMARVASLEAPSTGFMLALVVPILALAALFWRFVEQPFRTPAAAGGLSRSRVYAGASAVMAPLLAIGMALHFSSGMPGRFPELAADSNGFGAAQNISYNLKPHALTGQPLPDHRTSGLSVMVIGNSYARDFINMAQDGAGLPADRFSYFEIEGCSLQSPPPWVITNLARASHVVMGSGVSAGGHVCVEQMIAEIARLTGGEILLIGLKNFGWNNNALMRVPAPDRYDIRVPVLEETLIDNRSSLAHAARGGFAPARYIDMLALVIDDDGRVPVFTPDRQLISQDRKHLTPAGARYIGKKLFDGPAASLRAATPTELRQP